MEKVHLPVSKSQENPNQLVCKLPHRLGSGAVTVESFPSGLSLLYMDLKPSDPITIVGNNTNWSAGISFNLIGHSEVRSLEHRKVLSSIPDTNAHYVYPTPQKIEEVIEARRKVKVAILFNKTTLLELAQEDEEPFLPFLKGLQSQVPVAEYGKISPEMQRALHQLITCPYCGKTRAIFMEGKLMEIFAHKLEELREKGKGLGQQPRISASDLERIHFAAELLLRDPINPPDLTDLAGKIGMSRSKFYSHFKLVFGHSPMDHLRRHRLETARQLLKQGNQNITEVAFTVGFNSLSYFTRSFNAEFGISPRQII